MRNYNDSSYQTLPRTGSLSRSRSQNHYYIQANQFQKRYQNSLYNAYKIKSSKKCPPCCNSNVQRQFQSYMTFNQNEGDYNKGNTVVQKEYYENSHFNNQSDNKTVTKLQNSKRYLQQLLQKAQLNLKINKQKTDGQVFTLEKLLQTKNEQIHELNKQILRLKKISIQNYPNSGNQSYIKADQSYLVQIQNKDDHIKQIQRKVSRLRQQNSYFRQDLQIKNKQIQQIKSKFKLKQQNDSSHKKQLQKQISGLNQEKRDLIQQINLIQKLKEEIVRQVQKQRQKNKYIESQLQSYKFKYNQLRENNEKSFVRNNQKIKLFESQFRTLKQKSHQKDMQIQGLISKINCIQSQLDFFKDKFTNLLFQIQRQQRQSATIYQQAQTLKYQVEKIYEEIQKVRQSQIIELQSHKGSKVKVYNYSDPIDQRLQQSHIYNKGGLGRQLNYNHYSPKSFNRDNQMMVQSGVQFLQRFSSRNMSISPIRNKYCHSS